MSEQSDWRYCGKCHSLFFNGYPEKGACSASGVHEAIGYNFVLSHDVPGTPTAQDAWRYCGKCHGMFYDGYPEKGACPAGGGHEAIGYNFVLSHDVPGTPTDQDAWRYCSKCHGMFYDGYPEKGACPVGGGHEAIGYNFVLPHSLQDQIMKSPLEVLEPAKPEGPASGDFQHEGPVWYMSLDNDDTITLATLLVSGGGAIAAAFGPLWPAVLAALTSASGYILTINKLGGNNGVEINGVIGTLGVIVTPRVGKVYGELIKAARLGVSGRTILEFVLFAASKVPALATALDIPVAASIFNAVASGTPLGWAIAGGLGLAVDLLGSAPDPNQHGGVHADRDDAQPWESFSLAQIGEGNRVTLLSWQGFFSAQSGGGSSVFANRPEVGEWETWTLIDNNDGTVSFQTVNGHFLVAEEGGGRECWANRTSIGPWEKFVLVNLPNGKVALKTHDKGKFVSVQSGL